MTNQPGGLNQVPPAILGGVVGTEEMAEESKEPESERLSQLPEHENDRTRGVTGSTGAGVLGMGGTSDEGVDTSGLPKADETA